jgi:hypothetical protein
MALDPVTAALGIGSQLIDRLWPSEEQKSEARLELLKLAQSGELTVLTSRAGIIQAEAASSHWLAANWRPLTMLVFVSLIVARWFGFAAPELAPEEYLKLWDIVELALGGYVIGRSAEKILPSVISSIKR